MNTNTVAMNTAAFIKILNIIALIFFILFKKDFFVIFFNIFNKRLFLIFGFYSFVFFTDFLFHYKIYTFTYSIF